MRPTTAEREALGDILNPLDHVIPTLDRLDDASDGEHHFCVRTLDKAGSDFMTLMRAGDDTALSLYARPVLARAPNGSRQWLVRNQTLLRTTDDDLLLVTGNVLNCQKGGNHPLGISTLHLSEIHDTTIYDDEGRVGFFALLSHLTQLMEDVHPDNWIDEEGVEARLGSACSYGEVCMKIAFDQ